MHNQSSFKVTWTPHDHRMITWLTSESLQTQAPGHLMTNHHMGRRTTTQRVRCPLCPPNQSHDQQLSIIIIIQVCVDHRVTKYELCPMTEDSAIRIDCDSAEFV